MRGRDRTARVGIHHDDVAMVGSHGGGVANAAAAEAGELILGPLTLEEHRD